MTSYPKNKITPKITVEPEINKDLSNAAKLADHIRTELNKTAGLKPKIEKHQSRGSQ